jgi:hypothetical protein
LVAFVKRSGWRAAKPGERAFLDEFGVESGNSVHRVTPEDREVRHAHMRNRRLVDDRHRLPCRRIELRAVEGDDSESAIEFADDFHVPRKDAFHHRNRPTLQRFREQRVVRVAEVSFTRSKAVSHPTACWSSRARIEFGDGQRRMRVVHL